MPSPPTSRRHGSNLALAGMMAILGGLAACTARVNDPGAGSPSARLEQVVEANILGVHAFQVHLARDTGRGDPGCYASELSDADLEVLDHHQAALLAQDPDEVRAWTEGRDSTFDPTKDLEPLLDAGLTLAGGLPVEVVTRDLAARAPAGTSAEIRAVANLYQTVLEVDRDGDRLQELFTFYIGLGLPVYPGQLGLPGSDDDLLAVGEELEGECCASPVGTTAGEWQLAGRKVWNWGEKNQGIRDARVLADELLAEPDLAALLPRLRELPPRRIAVIGHSFTMDLHWSSPSAFVPVVTAMLARENLAVEVRQFQAGGLTASRAYHRFYEDALAWKPDTVLFVVANRTDEDLEAFRTMGHGFVEAGATVYTFDDIREPEAGHPGDAERDAAAAREAGMTVVEVGALLQSSPDRDRFVCLDGIHMTEPYHRLMAREWLKLLVGAREASLES